MKFTQQVSVLISIRLFNVNKGTAGARWTNINANATKHLWLDLSMHETFNNKSELQYKEISNSVSHYVVKITRLVISRQFRVKFLPEKRICC